MPKASSEQLATLRAALGELEARRRGIDLLGLDRQRAADLIAAALVELGDPGIGPTSTTLPERREARRRRRAKSTEYWRTYSDRLAEAMADDPEHEKHGTLTGYTAGRCRDDCCQEARRRYAARKRAG